MALDDLVDAVVPYNPKPVWLHLYVWPFVVLYACCLSTWTIGFGMNDYFEAGCIAMVVVGILQILAVLFCQWFVTVRCWMTCTKATTARDAKLVKVVPTANNGSAELVPLYVSKNSKGEKVIWFMFQKLKYIYDYGKAEEFRAVTFPADSIFSFYQQAKGHEDETSLADTRDHYGNNRMDMHIPTFSELFEERATAPFFAFQVFCVALWCLDEYWYYSVFTLAMLVMFEATLVKQQLRNMAEIRNMGNKPYMIHVYRSRKWTKVSTDDLVTGDIVSVSRSKDENTLPCDILLLRGNCIVDESMLTGESVLQMKEAIEEVEPRKQLDAESDGKLFILFGGTKVAQHTPPAKNSAGLKAPDNGCVGYVLRTGFNTSQGRLLRTILFGVKRVTANNKETFSFILFLLIFAIAAAAYVWIKGSEDESRSKYKLFLECTLILTSVVPPELPIELSLAVNNSLLALQKLGVYCTEPFRIPFAGKVDICCFDKTGTLTTDNLIVEGIAGINGSVEVIPIVDAPLESIQILASCHSLVQMDDELVGDPLEKHTRCYFKASVLDDTVIPKKGKQLPLKIFHRYHFSSAMKRMSVIAGYIPVGTPDVHHLAVVKGAPETLKAFYHDAPSNYDEIYQKFTRQGARVLALGIKELGQLSHQQVRELSRDEVETGLRYAGFVIVSCPLKADSKAVIKEIQYSSHEVVMITGDNPLTACHVAKVLRFTKGSAMLILDKSSSDWKWVSVDNSITLDVVPRDSTAFIRKYDLCITGQAFTYLNESHPDFLVQVLPRVTVFARMAPKQKEHVITTLKRLGHVTLMCGDGTNDVGALKHADVGVALLSHPLVDKSKAVDAVQDEINGPKKADPHSATMSNSVGTPSGSRNLGPANLPHGVRKRMPPGRREDARAAANVGQMTTAQKKLQQMMKDLEEEEKSQIVRLGDASVAAPFTSKYSSIQSTCHVIKQGRCTLVTTLQMFKILALNALVLAYSQSVLYLDGIKFSDSQATVQGLLLAACFLFVSRSQPLKSLSQQRPLTNIFNVYTLLTVTCQFAVHLACLFHLVKEAHALSPPSEDKFVKLDSAFKPSILNTTVYIISVALQISTFAVNYRGRPFMASLLENKALAWSLVASLGSVLALASGLVPELAEKFELVILPTEHRNTVILTLAADMIGCLIIDRILQFLLGDVRIRTKKVDTSD